MAGNVLEIPGGGATLPDVVPTRETWFRNLGKSLPTGIFFDPRLRVPQGSSAGSGVGGCCPCSGQQPYSYPGQQPNPYNMPQNPALGQPDRPVKPFQPMMPNDPCQPVREALNKIGTTPEELKRALSPQGGCGPKKAKRKKAKAKTKAKARRRTTTKAKRKKARRSKLPPFYEPDSLTKKQLAAARRKGMPGVARGNLRLLSNGACYDPRTKKFVKRSRCA